MDWKQAFEALKRAKAQLQELDGEATFEGDDDDVERMNRISMDTVGFFKKVGFVPSGRIDKRGGRERGHYCRKEAMEPLPLILAFVASSLVLNVEGNGALM